YIHGHTVGGTNPSLVEALGAKSAVLAHNNRFNRWVAGKTAHYFSDEVECVRELDLLFKDDNLILEMKTGSHEQIKKKFTWDKIHTSYENLLLMDVS
ncbi:MAG: glycosyltransferase, partial [Desulfobacteraceae bacterium]